MSDTDRRTISGMAEPMRTTRRINLEHLDELEFTKTRRGYDVEEVRGALVTIGRQVRAMIDERERLNDQLRRSEEKVDDLLSRPAPTPDRHDLTRLLGDEMVRLLDNAKETADGIVASAEGDAATLIDEAEQSAMQIRAQAEEHIAARRSEAADEEREILERANAFMAERQLEAEHAAAEAELKIESEFAAARLACKEQLDSAREEGRAMIVEARQFRETILRDLAGRRKIARKQLEAMRAAQERLLEAFTSCAIAVEGATSELHTALPAAKAAADLAADRVNDDIEQVVNELEQAIHTGELPALVLRGIERPKIRSNALPRTEGDDVLDQGSVASDVDSPELTPDVASTSDDISEYFDADAHADVAVVDARDADMRVADGGDAEDAVDTDADADRPLDRLRGEGRKHNRFESVDADWSEGDELRNSDDIDYHDDDDDGRDGVDETSDDHRQRFGVIDGEGLDSRPNHDRFAAQSYDYFEDDVEFDDDDLDEDQRPSLRLLDGDGGRESTESARGGEAGDLPGGDLPNADLPNADLPSGDGFEALDDLGSPDELVDESQNLGPSDLGDIVGGVDDPVGDPSDESRGDGSDAVVDLPIADGLESVLSEPDDADADGGESHAWNDVSAVTDSSSVDAADDSPSVDGLFARLRADRDAAVTAAREVLDHSLSDEALGAPSDAARLLDLRDEWVGSVERNVARRFKRVLDDEQNDVMDRIRRSKKLESPTIMGSPDDLAASYLAAGSEELLHAVSAGAASLRELGAASRPIDPQTIVDKLGPIVKGLLVLPWIERIEALVDEANGERTLLTNSVRTAYKYRKMDHLAELSGSVVVAAFNAGVAAATHRDGLLEWVVDHGSDLESVPHFESISGNDPERAIEVIGRGVVGQGCRCMLVPLDRA